jgi:uncharacterized membrane protein YjgN (DUF898 family)
METFPHPPHDDAPPAAEGEAPSDAGSAQRFRHHGRVGELFAITVVNLLLKAVTLGLYHFWGKARVRRYVWSRTSFAGERFEYTGTGFELLRGFVLAMMVLVPLAVGWESLTALLQQAIAERLAEEHPEFLWLLVLLSVLLTLAGYGLLLFLIGFARYSARRYLLSRTRWRSIRFALTGSALAHGRRKAWYSLLTVFTLGFYFPFMRARLAANLLDHTWFGDRRMAFAGSGGALLGRYMAALALTALVGLGWTLLLLPAVGGLLGMFSAAPRPGMAFLPLVTVAAAVLGFYLPWSAVWFWYRAGELRHFTRCTSLGTVRFRAGYTIGGFIGLWMGNLVLLLLTLGLAYPVAVVRTARFLSDNLHMAGELDLAGIAQSPEGVMGSGEGLAEALDLGSI